MSERRHLKRWRLIYYLRVFEQGSGTLLGHVADITTGGMMLVSERALPVDHPFSVCVEYPQSGGGKGRLYLTARSIWTGRDVNRDLRATGFRLVYPTPEAIAGIRDVIEELRFPGPPETAPGDGLGLAAA